MVRIETEIRLAASGDAEPIRAIYAPLVTETTVSFEYQPPGIDEVARRIEAGSGDFPWLVCESAGQIRGYAYAGRFRDRPAYAWTAEVSVYVDPQDQRRGIARALYTALLGCLEMQGFQSAVAAIALPNDASVRLHQSFGFRQIGTIQQAGFKLGGWCDVGWYQLGLREPGGAPGRCLRMGEVTVTAAWRELLSRASGLVR